MIASAPWAQRLDESDADHRAMMRWAEQGPGRGPPIEGDLARIHDWQRRVRAWDLAQTTTGDPRKDLLAAYVDLCQVARVAMGLTLQQILTDPLSVPLPDRMRLTELAARLPALAQGLPTETQVHLHETIPDDVAEQIADVFARARREGLLLDSK